MSVDPEAARRRRKDFAMAEVGHGAELPAGRSVSLGPDACYP